MKVVFISKLNLVYEALQSVQNGTYLTHIDVFLYSRSL